MDRGTWRERGRRTDLEQASLRVRLAATAVGTTILLLVPGHDHVAAGSLLLGYATVALILRANGGRIPGGGWIGVAMDVLFATGLSLLLPLSAAWVLYLFAIGIAAMRTGIHGLAVASALCVVAYDALLVARGGEALATDLWRVQALLAFAVLVAELVRVSAGWQRERQELRSYSLAQRDLAAAGSVEALLERLVDHAVRGFGASSARIVDRGSTRYVRGSVDGVEATTVTEVSLARDVTLHVAFATDEPGARSTAALRDLAADSRPLLEAATERARERRERDAERRLLAAVHQLGREVTRAGVLAQVITTAQELAGPSAIVRPADGERVVGDLEAEVATAIAREGVPPTLVSGEATSAAVVAIGQGLVLVALGTRRALEESDLAGLALLGEAAAASLDRVTERGILVSTAAELRSRSEDLERGLRQRDDAVASAVHELRNPLTSVQAYGQLMSRHLTAVQRQVTQLDALIEDLLQGSSGTPPAPRVETADLTQETLEAVSRLRVSVPESDVRVIAPATTGSREAAIDPGRVAQVLDNVLRNAVKYSRPGAPVSVTVSRTGDEVLIAVSDSGDGIAPEDLERIFERYARGAQHAGALPGAGIGLAISREIVTAHGGRIWAESAGPGEGSTFTIALPAATAAVDAERRA